MAYETLPEFETAARNFTADTARRYRQLADAMDGLAKHDTAAAFRKLEALERDAAQGMFGDVTAIADDSAGLWVGEEDDLLPEDIADSIYSMTPVRAINLALHNSRRALQLMTQASAHTRDDRVRVLARRLYHMLYDQTVHLRLERRLAARGQDAGPLDADLARLIASRKDIGAYRRNRDICRERLGALLRNIADGTSGAARRELHGVADEINPSPVTAPDDFGQISEGRPVAQAIAALEGLFDTLLDTAQRSDDEALFRLAQADAKCLLPAMRRLHEAASSYTNLH